MIQLCLVFCTAFLIVDLTCHETDKTVERKKKKKKKKRRKLMMFRATFGDINLMCDILTQVCWCDLKFLPHPPTQAM